MEQLKQERCPRRRFKAPTKRRSIRDGAARLARLNKPKAVWLFVS